MMPRKYGLPSLLQIPPVDVQHVEVSKKDKNKIESIKIKKPHAKKAINSDASASSNDH